MQKVQKTYGFSMFLQKMHKNTNFFKVFCILLPTSLTGGNLVDGLPPAAHTPGTINLRTLQNSKIWAKIFSKFNFRESKASPGFSSGPPTAIYMNFVSS